MKPAVSLALSEHALTVRLKFDGADGTPAEQEPSENAPPRSCKEGEFAHGR